MLFPRGVGSTLIYALAYVPGDGVTGIGWLFVALGVVADLSSYGGSGRLGRRG